MGMVISVGLSKRNKVCILLLIKGVQAKSHGVFDNVWTDCIALIIKPPIAIEITSLRTPMVHTPERKKLDSNWPVTSTTLVMVTQNSSRQGRERSFPISPFQRREFIHQLPSLLEMTFL